MVLVVAHRGSNADLPEHSLAAYLRAIEESADALECDVRLTADGTAVLVHDRSTRRTTGLTGLVSKESLGDLLRRDWSRDRQRWEGVEEATNDEHASGLLTLRRFLLEVIERDPAMAFSIETKHPTRYRGYVELEVVDVLAGLGLLGPFEPGRERVRLMSFSAVALRRLQRLAPHVPRVFLMDRIWPWRRDGSLPAGASIAGISVEAMERDPGYVSRVHDRGHAVHVWTVDTPEQAQACLDLGVDAIISNRPGMVRGMTDPRTGSNASG